jgi:hypothetical protein
MKSITDLNGIGLNTTDYTDNRDPSVTFTTLYPVSQPLTVYQGAAHILPVASDITEIINFSQAAVSYIIDLRTTQLDCTVQWTTIPAGCILTNPAHNVWKITGINSVATWNAIKNPTVTINENVLTDISYLVTIEYLTTKYVSWNVNIHTLLYDVLSDGSVFYFEDGYDQLIDNGPNVFDYRATQSTWTVTITPDDTTVFTSIYTSGIGGTSSVNPSTKVVTITGTKTQVNSHLDNLYMNFPANNTLDMNLTYFAINGTGTLSMSKTQSLVCNTVRYLGFSGSDNYAEDNSFTLTGLPLITNYATTTYEGNTPKTLNIIDTLYDLTATGPSFSGDVVFSPSYTPAIGTGSFVFNAQNDGYLYAQNTNVGQMGSGNSTVELWFKPLTGYMTGSLHGIINKRNFSGVSPGSWGLGFNGTNNSLYFSEMPDVAGITTLTTAANTITRNSWQHIAVVRYNGTIKIWINGNLKATSASASTVDYSLNGNAVRIGDWDSQGGNQLQATYVDEIRVSTTARYTDYFFSPTTAFATDPYTTLLMHFEENARYDTSGSVSVNTLVKKLGTAALWFNRGALTANASYDWNWYASDYTCELFVYKTAVSPVIYPLEIGLKENTGTLNCWSFGIDNSNKGRFYYYDGTERHIIGTSTLALNTWHHLAFTFTKKTNQIKLFVNGIVEATFKVTGTPLYYNTVLLNLGKYANNSFSGYMDEIRISKTVRYTNNFTPPTTAFTVDNYTNFLLHGDGYNGSVITDSSTSITGANYTYTITPSDTTAWRNISSTGVGGTFTTNNNVVTITGNKSQVNNRLSTITLRPASDYTSSYTITANATMPEGVQKSRTYGINCLYVHDEVANVGGSRAFSYDTVGTLVFASNTPQITDLDETTPNYTITLTSSMGKFGTSAANAVTNYSYTGTKAQINALFPTILFVVTPGIYGTGSYTYTQTKGAVLQNTTSGFLVGPTYLYSPTTIPAFTSETIAEGTSGTFTNPLTISYLSAPLTVTIIPTNIVNGQNVPDFNWTVSFAAMDGGINRTQGANSNIIVLSGIDTIAKFNSIKNFTYQSSSYFNGTFDIEFRISDSFSVTLGKHVTVTEEYPMSVLTTTAYTYSNTSSGVTLNAKSIGLVPTLVDTGETSYIWTLTLTPSFLNVVSYSGLAATGATFSQTASGILTLTGTISQINTRLASLLITIIPNVNYDFSMTWYASNSTTTETSNRTFALSNVNTSVLGLTRASETFFPNSSTLITNGPLITSGETGTFKLEVYSEDMATMTNMTGYSIVYVTDSTPTGQSIGSIASSSNIPLRYVMCSDGSTAAFMYYQSISSVNYPRCAVYKRTGDTWSLMETLLPPTGNGVTEDWGTINGPQPNLYMNTTGTKLYIGARDASTGTKKVYIYTRSGNTFGNPGLVTLGLSGELHDVAENGTFMAVANVYSGGSGSVTIYNSSGTAIYGYNDPLLSTTTSQHYGARVSLSGDGNYTAVVTEGPTQIYIYKNEAGTSNDAILPLAYSGSHSMSTPGELRLNYDGTRVTLVVRNPANVRVYIFSRSGNTWTLVNSFTDSGGWTAQSTISPDVNNIWIGGGNYITTDGSTGVVSVPMSGYGTVLTDNLGRKTGFNPTAGIIYSYLQTKQAGNPSFTAALPNPLTFNGSKEDLNILIDNIYLTTSRTGTFQLIYKATTPSGVIVLRNQTVNRG